VQERLSALRAAESKQRDVFHAQYKLPAGFFPFLMERPTACDMQLKDYDAGLPAIDEPLPPTASAASTATPTPVTSSQPSASTSASPAAATDLKAEDKGK
jgi:hypothetical protein